MAASEQGTEYAAWVASQLQREYDRRDSVNSRAGAAVTSATGLVTLELAIVAFARGDKYIGSGSVLAAVVVAVLLLLLSAVAAVVAGLPWRYTVLDAGSITEMLTTHWVDTEVRARNTTAFFNLDELAGLRNGNSVKTRWLKWSFIGQTAAIAALSVGVVLIIR